MILRKSSIKIAWLLVVPVLLIRGLTTVYPIIKTVLNSFYDIRILRGIEQFTGIKNYLEIFKDDKVLTSIEFTIIFVIVSMSFHIILGTALALVLNMKFAGRKFLRTIVLIPWAMPSVVVGIAAKWAFNNDYGLINDFIRWFNPRFELHWLVHTWSARYAVIMADLWKGLPFFAVLVLAGLQFISNDVYEAAKIDGANKIGSFFYITLPLIARNILVLCIPFTLWRLTSFDIVYSMTSGGPGEDTSLIAHRISMEAFTNLNVGYAASLAVLLFIVMIIFSLFNLRAVKKYRI